MDLAGIATAQKAAAIRHETGVGVLKKLQGQQQLEGQAAVSLIESSGSVQKGAPEPGKGSLVDVVA